MRRSIIYPSIIIGLTTDRDTLYNHINKRVDIMMDEGLLDEVNYLYSLDLKYFFTNKVINNSL